jgi:hypothetical protein
VVAKARRGTGIFRQDWFRALRSSLGGAPLPANVLVLADHPKAVVRLYVAGIRWTEDGDVPAARAAAITAIQSGEAHEVCMGCQLLTQLGATAGDVRPLVWDYLRHPNWLVRGNAGYVLLKCCPDARVWAEAAAVLEAESTGDNLDGAFIRYAVHRLRKAVEPEVAPNRSVRFSPEWRTSTAVALARQMYDSRDFSAMPILADALQDAGCDSADILDHCRGPGPHVRGCWVVDLVLGNE